MYVSRPACTRRAGTSRRERGTVLLLMPAAVFILCVLGALVVDSAHATMRRRELQNAADAAANDAAALSLDPVTLRRGSVLLDPDAADAAARASLQRQRIGGLTSISVRVEAGDTVVVELEAEHPSVFARSLPGAAPTVHVPARARAQAVVAGEAPVPRGG